MKKLEFFLKPTQKELFNLLHKMYREDAVVHAGNYILVPGKAPIMLIAHLDTVHKEPVKCICKSLEGRILMSPQGIGGDDRCGVYALVKAHEVSPVKPWLLFTCNEEIGGLGAEKFVEDYSKGKLPKGLDKLKLLIEIDRKGSNDAVYYDCDNRELEAYITSKGFVTAIGSFSDISIIAPELGVAAVNLSSGFYNAHTLHEYINRRELDLIIRSVVGIVADAAKPDFPKYKYVKRVWEYMNFNTLDIWNIGGELHSYDKVKIEAPTNITEEAIPGDLPGYMTEMYNDLLELYDIKELEWYRKEFGNQVICRIYEDEFGPFLGKDDIDEYGKEKQ